MFTFIHIHQAWSFYVMTNRDTSANMPVACNEQVKLAKTTNSDEKVVVNEDAGSYDRPLDVGKHYVVRRLDGSLRE